MPRESTNRKAAFRRLAQDLRVQVLRGDYPADTPLPTEAQLAEKYSVSRQSVRRAFQDLVSENIVFGCLVEVLSACRRRGDTFASSDLSRI